MMKRIVFWGLDKDKKQRGDIQVFLQLILHLKNGAIYSGWACLQHTDNMIVYLQQLMGSLISKLKRQDKMNGRQVCMRQGRPQPPQREEQKAEQKVLIKRQKRIIEQKEGILVFKEISANKKVAIQKSPNIIQLLQSDKWIVHPDIIQDFRILNAFQHVEQSPALALYVTLIKDGVTLIGNIDKLNLMRAQHKNKENEPITLFNEYAIIYADLFSINFSVLKKIKIRGPQKVSAQALCSLQGLTKINAPCLEELSADDHVFTNMRFLRRCNWPNLWKLSLRGNMIVDSAKISSVMPLITNSRHIEGIDLAGPYSTGWVEVSWVAKMGFVDAEEEFNLLNNDEEYYYRYNNRVLRRVDSGMSQRMRAPHVEMIRKKFNNAYFDNPISFW